MPVDPQCHCFSNPADLINGIPVSAETLQPILDSLYANDLFVKSILDYFEMPSALKRCVEINPAIEVGQPVFYSSTTSRFELARYASVVSDSGRVFLDDTAEVWGILQEKTATDAGIIIICGMATVDISAAIGGETPVGKFYLDSTAGQLTLTPPDELAPVYVLSALADGSILFRPWSGEYAGIVLQWKRELVALVAGTGSVVDGRGVIDTVDAEAPGWLPADHVSFGGNAPEGALFGYNIAQDSNLAGLWPPRYLQTVYLDLDRAIDPAIGGTSVPLGSEGLAVVDENGIWWLSDCETDLPFDVTESSASELGICPRSPAKRLTMYAARPAGFAAGSSSQTSLISKHPAFRFVQRDGTALAESGSLDFTFDPDKLLSATASDTLGLATKRSLDGKLSRGPVVTSIKSASPQITVTGASEYGDGYQHGEVTIDASGFIQQELLPLTVALSRAEEEIAFGTLGIGLPPYRPSSFRSQFVIPLGINGRARVSYRVWVMANYPNNGGSFAPTTEQLDMVARIVPQPNAATLVSATSDVAVAFPASPIVHATAYEQISASFIADAGDVVYTELFRTPESRVHELHVLKHFLFIHEVLPLDDGPTTCEPCEPTTTTSTVGPTTTTTVGPTTTTTVGPTTTTTTTVGPTTTTVPPLLTTQPPIPDAMSCCPNDPYEACEPGELVLSNFMLQTLNSEAATAPAMSYCPWISNRLVSADGIEEFTVAWEYSGDSLPASPGAVFKYNGQFEVVSYDPPLGTDGSIDTLILSENVAGLFSPYPWELAGGTGTTSRATSFGTAINWGDQTATSYSVRLRLSEDYQCIEKPPETVDDPSTWTYVSPYTTLHMQVTSEADADYGYESFGHCCPPCVDEGRQIPEFQHLLGSGASLATLDYCFLPISYPNNANFSDPDHGDYNPTVLTLYPSGDDYVIHDYNMPTPVKIKWRITTLGDFVPPEFPHMVATIFGAARVVEVSPSPGFFLDGVSNPGSGFTFNHAFEVKETVVRWGDIVDTEYEMLIQLDRPCTGAEAADAPIRIEISADNYPDVSYFAELTCCEPVLTGPTCETNEWPYGGRQVDAIELDNVMAPNNIPFSVPILDAGGYQDLFAGTLVGETWTDQTAWVGDPDYTTTNVRAKAIADVGYIWLDDTDVSPSLIQDQNLVKITFTYDDETLDDFGSPRATFVFRGPSHQIVYSWPPVLDAMHPDYDPADPAFQTESASTPFGLPTTRIHWPNSTEKTYVVIVAVTETENCNYTPDTVYFETTLAGQIEIGTMSGATDDIGQFRTYDILCCPPEIPTPACGTGCIEYEGASPFDSQHQTIEWSGAVDVECPINPEAVPADWEYPGQIIRWEGGSGFYFRYRNLDVTVIHPLTERYTSLGSPVPYTTSTVGDTTEIHWLSHTPNHPYYQWQADPPGSLTEVVGNPYSEVAGLFAVYIKPNYQTVESNPGNSWYQIISAIEADGVADLDTLPKRVLAVCPEVIPPIIPFNVIREYPDTAPTDFLVSLSDVHAGHAYTELSSTALRFELPAGLIAGATITSAEITFDALSREPADVTGYNSAEMETVSIEFKIRSGTDQTLPVTVADIDGISLRPEVATVGGPDSGAGTLVTWPASPYDPFALQVPPTAPAGSLDITAVMQAALTAGDLSSGYMCVIARRLAAVDEILIVGTAPKLILTYEPA